MVRINPCICQHHTVYVKTTTVVIAWVTLQGHSLFGWLMWYKQILYTPASEGTHALLTLTPVISIGSNDWLNWQQINLQLFALLVSILCHEADKRCLHTDASMLPKRFTTMLLYGTIGLTYTWGVLCTKLWCITCVMIFLSWSVIVPIMACYLTVTSLYLNRCWHFATSPKSFSPQTLLASIRWMYINVVY